MNSLEEMIVHSDICDKIVVLRLAQDIAMIKSDIAKLRKIKKPEQYQQDDLDHNVATLDALNRIYDYYGGNCYE